MRSTTPHPRPLSSLPTPAWRFRSLSLTGALLLAACHGERDLPALQELGGAPAPDLEPSDRCDTPQPGCPCATDGERIPCSDVHSRVGDQLVCGSGESLCEGGAFGACVFTGDVRLLSSAGVQTLALGGPEACQNNPCNPECMTFKDDPSGLGDAGSGIAEGPDGLTLVGDTGLDAGGCTGGKSGSCAHSICAVGEKLKQGCDAKGGSPSCVAKVCAKDARCCNTAWDAACIALLDSECDATCYADTDGACVACFNDSFDHDGDGFSGKQGDCLDCDANVNPGAFDFPSNGVDEDCDGTADNEVEVCDQGLALTSSDPYAHARAIDLCRKTTKGAQGKDRVWGVTDARLVQASGNGAPHGRGYALQASFGAGNATRRGDRMAVYSSGTARTPGQSGYVNPSGQFGSYDAGTSVSFPPGFPKNATGCPVSGNKAYDSSGLRLTVRVPTNAKSFSYNFKFLSSEYPEWVCTAYNDHFVALLSGSSAVPKNPAKNSDNVSFDGNGNPVSVNIAFFTEPSCPTCTSPALAGTGFDGKCDGQSCGGATEWLYTSAPVVGGEEITVHFAVWDQGDHVWDSTALIDNWRWSVHTSDIATGAEPPSPPQTTYEPGTFTRDYDASGLCGYGKTLRWGHWSWQATTPSDSRIAFSIRTAPTLEGLDVATDYELRFSDAPASLVGAPAVARKGPPDTQHGAAVVDTTLAQNNAPRYHRFLRVSSRLTPSATKLHAPTLHAWNLQTTCVDDE